MESTSIKINKAQSTVTFSVKKLGFLTINGTVTNLKGNIVFDIYDLENSYFDVSVLASTIDTGNAKRDEHLKSGDFFDVNNFPKISFKSSSIKKGNEQFEATGNLTILRKTKEISIPFSYQNGTFNGNFSLNRLDYDLGPKFPSFIVGKSIQLSITVKTM